MNPSYFRIRLEQLSAMERFASWLGKPELEAPSVVAISEVVDLSCDEAGNWKGSSLYLYEKEGWTIFEDMSGHFGAIPGVTWLRFAGADNFIFAGYNDAIGYGEFIAIQGGDVVKEFLCDEDNPDDNVNSGKQPSAFESIDSWMKVAAFIDEDKRFSSETGLLWLH